MGELSQTKPQYETNKETTAQIQALHFESFIDYYRSIDFLY
jgi:hypothetical protein